MYLIIFISYGCRVFFMLGANVGGMASKGLRNCVPINRDKSLKRAMTFENP